MKIYITADIEGVAGITHWDEASETKPDYHEFRVEMTEEVLAACDGAIAAGAKEIWIKDAHRSGRNILTSNLPACARIIRGWSGHPVDMVQEVDNSFTAILMVGYHSKAGSDANPLAHSVTRNVRELLINGQQASEFLVHAYAAALYDVPVVFVSGDQGLCNDIRSINPNVQTVAVSQGSGSSTVSLAPVEAKRLIREGVKRALGMDLRACGLSLAEHFVIEISYHLPTNAYSASFYPGAEQVGTHTIRFETDQYFEVMRLLKFAV
jgi:D-amino peptidase